MEKIDIDQNIEALDFGSPFEIRIRVVCHAHGIISVRDLCRYSQPDLMEMRHCGRKTVGRIEAVLDRYGLRPGMTGKELDEYATMARNGKETAAAASVREDAEAARWEQRRYEVARDLLVHCGLVAGEAVERADKLISALKGLSEPQTAPKVYEGPF